MGTLRILSRRGDDYATWDLLNVTMGDPEALAAVREAERIFNEARAQGATAFTVKSDHSIERIAWFDQTVEQMVLIPRVVGG
jgi:hypothetical protein